jgi:uncharacterized membrane protein
MMDTAPIIIKSWNRLATGDLLMADQNYLVNTEAWEEVKATVRNLGQQNEAMVEY